MNYTINDIFKKHKVWVDIVCSFGCNPQTAEDIVQEMYIKIHKKKQSGLNIDYGDNDFNYYYVFRTLKNLFYDLKRKQNKVKIIDIEYCNNMISNENFIDYQITYNEIKKTLNKMYWYDKKVYELIESGQSVAQLSRKTGIPYYSLYNTYKKVVKLLKNKI
jgi:DNA-directed RNA polymerase specialized sigma24 family protein